MARQQQNVCTSNDPEPSSIENQLLLLMLHVHGLPPSQTRNELSWKQKEKANITPRTSLFGAVRNILKLNHAKSEDNVTPYITNRKAEASEIIANRRAIEMSEALFRTARLAQ